MKKDDNKVEFDLSALSLEELINVYNNITDFLIFLEDSKIVQKDVLND